MADAISGIVATVMIGVFGSLLMTVDLTGSQTTPVDIKIVGMGGDLSTTCDKGNVCSRLVSAGDSVRLSVSNTTGFLGWSLCPTVDQELGSMCEFNMPGYLVKVTPAFQ